MRISSRRIRSVATIVASTAALVSSGAPLLSQARVDNGRHTRWQRLGRDLGYGILEGVGFAGVDQARKDPKEWGDGGNGFGRRAASDVGEFVIQESVTEGLAAALDRPLDYARCGCRSAGGRVGHALALSVVDQMPDGHHALAIPRIVGAFGGAFAQASWRPGPSSDRVRVALANAGTSLAIGAGINLFHEFVK